MDEPIKMTIKSARINKGYSRDEAGALIGVSATTIGHWETGKHHPSVEKARKISEVYEVSLNNLIF